MKSELYKLFNFDYNHQYKREINQVHDYIIELYKQNLPEDLSILLEEWRLKGLILKGLTFNNLHLITNDDVYQNALRCLTKRDTLNKTIVNKPTTLHLYYNDKCFNFDELRKLESLTFDRRFVYVNNYDIVGTVGSYLQSHNYEIVYVIGGVEDVFGYKMNMFFNVTDDNIDSLESIVERLSQAHTKCLYCHLTTNKQRTMKKYYRVLKKNSCIRDVNYLLGEHIGVDENQFLYMKLNDAVVYETKKKTFQDFYVSHSYLSKHCMGCDKKMFCISHTLEENCRWRKI